MYDCTTFYIDGNWASPAGATPHDVINPATEQAVGRISLGSSADIDKAVAAARKAFAGFSQSSREERLALLDRIIAVYKTRMDDLARAVTAEMGAPATLAARAQVPSGLGHFMQARKALEHFEFEEPAGKTSRVFREPIGVVGLITPWNWPLNQIAAKLAPALAVGCTTVHKPSEIAPLSAHVLAEILDEAGVPAGVYNLVDGEGPVVGAAMSSHPGIDMISFTGSTRAGIDVAQKAATTVKRVTQELGGKSANIILEDAEFEKAVRRGVQACMNNTGQSCNAPTRMLVPGARMNAAMEIARATAEGIKVGDPSSEETVLGPIAYGRQYEKVREMIARGIEEGATLVTGGTDRPHGLNAGFFVAPTVFGNVTNDMTIAREEIFGPVLAILAYKDEDDAVAIANDTPYGLSNYVQGELEHARKVAARLQSGMVHLNGAGVDQAAPFGGYKASGNGREFAKYGFEDFLETKAVMGYEEA
ncbi:MAG: aldehyde dehydrogenase family protein [Proteobacteria bacterium]|nr:aldehyde dehydrogenase family protein [Pseudomonadota bacterium]